MPEKIALVTGASSGFGLLTSLELAKAGFRVVATMRDLQRRERMDEAIAAAGVAAKIDVRALDVTNFDTIQGFVDKVVADIRPAGRFGQQCGIRRWPDSPKTSSSTNCACNLKPIFSARSQ